MGCAVLLFFWGVGGGGVKDRNGRSEGSNY